MNVKYPLPSIKKSTVNRIGDKNFHEILTSILFPFQEMYENLKKKEVDEKLEKRIDNDENTHHISKHVKKSPV